MNIRSSDAARPPHSTGGIAAVGDAWNRFWFSPADSQPLSLVRIGAAAIALAAWWSYAADLQAWFGPAGVLPADTVREWRPPTGFSLFDWAVTPLALNAGPADDCLSILLWCLAIGPAGEYVSLDRWLANRAGRPVPAAGWRASIAEGLLQVHATAIAVGAVLAQLKGDVWWNGLAAWYLVTGPRSGAAGLVPLLERSEYLTNLLTHGVTAFEILFAIGMWCGPTQKLVARVGLVGWPLVGLLAGEPLWGLAMALFALPLAVRR